MTAQVETEETSEPENGQRGDGKQEELGVVEEGQGVVA